MSEKRLLGESAFESDAETRASARPGERGVDVGIGSSDASTADTVASDRAGLVDRKIGSEGRFGGLPEVFAGYTVLRELHRGGQGVVYVAKQEATRREVAIKVMKEGPFSGPHERARFEREVQILGRLRHPHIVAIHESGIAAGNQYFVMDYISGRSLDEYVRHAQLGLRAALELFAKICEAVNAAHLRGIIHRDLKPSNIRVDADGQPHVLDFGLAKALGEDADSDVVTLTGQFMGSLPWASPEQAEADPSRLDVRTDVYSLGVILYQMLTGRLPYKVTGSVSEALSVIRHVTPARPSTVQRRINNEVETIVLKCMAKERERRYQTAGELERDVRRYLRGEAIEAKRDSAWYVLSKTLRRYRGRAVSGMAFVVLLIGFAVTMTYAYGRVADEARKAEMVAGFLRGIVTSVDPEVARQGFDTPLHQALRETVDAAAGRIGDFDGEPEVQANLRTTIGRVYLNLGLYEEAEEQLAAAVATCQELYGKGDARTAEVLTLLGWALKETGVHEEAEQAYLSALAARRALFGDGDLAVAETLNGLGQLYYVQREMESAEPRLRQALEIRRRKGGAREIATSAANLGSLLRDMGQVEEAEVLLREALEIRRELFGEEHFHTVVSLNKLALLLRRRGETAEAHELFERALELRRKVVGPNHPHVGASLNNVGLVLLDEGAYGAAAEKFEGALAIWRDTLSPDDPRVLRAIVNQAVCRREGGEPGVAQALCEEALKRLPVESGERVVAELTLASAQVDVGRLGEAEASLRKLVGIADARFAAGHPVLGLVRVELGRCLREAGRLEEAEGYLVDAHTRLDAVYGSDGLRTVDVARELVLLYEEWGKAEQAEAYRGRLEERGE